MEAKANIAQQPWVFFGCFVGAPGGEPSLDGQDIVETWEAKAEVHAGDPEGDPAEPSLGTVSLHLQPTGRAKACP